MQRFKFRRRLGYLLKKYIQIKEIPVEKEIIVEKLGVNESEITENAKFIDDLGADSLDTVELIMQFEEDFSLEIPDEEAENILSVKQAVDYIVKNK